MEDGKNSRLGLLVASLVVDMILLFLGVVAVLENDDDEVDGLTPPLVPPGMLSVSAVMILY